MRITKRELLEKLAKELVPRMGGDPDISIEVQVGAIAAARALGWELVDESVPERLQLGAWYDGDGPCGSGRALRNAATQPNEDPALWAITRNDQMAAELVQRYNAKAAVLELAHELAEIANGRCSATDRVELAATRAGVLTAVTQLRAAYEEKP